MKKIFTSFFLLGMAIFSNTQDVLAQNTDKKVFDYVNRLYASLELSAEANQKQYDEGGVIFDKSAFNSLIDENSKLSEKRLDMLTGEYHERCNVELQKIDSVSFIGDKIIVYTKVLYTLDEMGGFYNNEKLEITKKGDNLVLLRWEDIKLYKMEKLEYEHMDGYKESDFYESVGSINK